MAEQETHTGAWVARKDGSQTLRLACGLSVTVWRKQAEQWRYVVRGWPALSMREFGAGTTELPVAKRRALRRLELELGIAMDQLSAAIVDCGTYLGS